MTLPLTHENYERLRDSGLDPLSDEGRAELHTQAKFTLNDLVTVHERNGALPDTDTLRTLVEPRVDTVRRMLYPLDNVAAAILRAHDEFRSDLLDAEVNTLLEQDQQRADKYQARSNVIAAIALRQAIVTLPEGSEGDMIDPIDIIDRSINLDAKIKTDFGHRWTVARLTNLYDTNPHLLLDRTRETIGARISRHYYALPVVSFGLNALKRARRAAWGDTSERQSAA